MRKLTKVLAGVAAAAIFTIGAALPAQAAGNDFTPSPNKFREYMLNVTSKVLKGAMPDAWKREQLANEFRYNHAWETMNAQFGFSAANPNYMGAPDSYDDYMVRKAQMNMQGGTGGKPFGAPATKPSLWQKTARVGGGLMALTAFPVGTMLGTGAVDFLGGWFGFDADAGVCSQSDGFEKTAEQLLTGRDCSMWAPTAEYLSSLAMFDLQCIVAGSTTDKALCWVPLGFQTVQSGTNRHIYYCAYGEVSAAADVPGVLASTSPGDRWIMETESGRKVAVTNAFRNTFQYGGGAPGMNVAKATFCPMLQAISSQLNVSQSQLDEFKTVGAITDFYFERSTSNGFVREDMVTKPNPLAAEEVELECEVTLDDGTVLRSRGAAFGAKSEALSPPSCPAVPDGRVATNVAVNEMPAGSPSGTPGTSVSTQPTTPEYQDWATTYPECGTGACKLDLIQKPKASCFDLEYQCADWFEDPDKANKYQCRYGVKDVDLEECAVYAGLFKPGRVDTGSPYTDPETGVWSGGKNAPEESRNAMGLPVQDPAHSRGCDGTSGSGSFDPIRFIMRPIQCALEWAFVPRPAVVEAELSGGEQAWNKKPPKVIADAVAGFSVSPSASGCSRSVTLLSSTDFATSAELFNFCPGSPARPLADFSRLATTAAMVVLVVVVVRRQISGMIGYGAGQ